MWLNVGGAAAVLEVGEGRVYRWIEEKNLPAVKINGQYYFNRTDLLEWAMVRQVPLSPAVYRLGKPDVPEPEVVDALMAGGILYNLDGEDQETVLKAAIAGMTLPEKCDRGMLLQLFLAREALGSTAVGDGIAIPHPRYPVILPVERPTLTLCFLARPFRFGRDTLRDVHTLFVLVCPTIRSHLRMLARIGGLLRDAGFRQALERRASPDELLAEIRRVERSFVNPSGNGPSQEHA